MTDIATRTLLVLAVAAAPLAVQAGRPLLVDDTGTNDKGNGHVEAWYEREPGGGHVWNLAPAFAVMEGVELSAALSRERPGDGAARAVQVKVSLTEPREQGCNLGASAAHTWLNQARGYGNQLVGIATCNASLGSAHFNLGALRPSLENRTLSLFGAALERPIGALTAHVEWLREQDAKPVTAAGLRTSIAKNLQIDASVARAERDTVITVGTKLSF
jgi:hypothetical protein